MRYSVAILGAVLAACSSTSGGGVPSAAPVTSSAQAIRDFMQAAADSNLARMGQLWGTSKGPAAVTNSPADFEKRLILIQTYLKADSSKIISDLSIPGENDKRQAEVRIYRDDPPSREPRRRGCMKQVPLVMIRLGNKGWIVNNVNLGTAGNPARPCEPS